MPVFGYGENLAELRELLERYDRIALGGLVPYAKDRKSLGRWLDRCFREVFKHARDGRIARIHILGIATPWLLDRYPCYSCDSSGWTAIFRYGHTRSSGLPIVPRSKSEAEIGSVMNALRSEVRQLASLQDRVSKSWEQRGIKFVEPI